MALNYVESFDKYTDKFQWLKSKCKLKHGVDLDKFDIEKIKAVCDYFARFRQLPKKYHHELGQILKVIETQTENYEFHIDAYLNAKASGTIRTSILLTKGRGALDAYDIKKIESHKRSIHPSTLEHWLNLGMSDIEANLALLDYSERKRDSLIKSHETRREYSNQLDNPYSIEYWQYRGYSIDDAQSQVLITKEKTNCSLESFIKRDGIELGTEKYNNIRKCVKATNILKYGRACSFSPRTSKESLKFFVPIYRNIRKLGIKKSDIAWGIKGSREYVINDVANSKIYFYDFIIKSLKICIEYHGIMWHPRGDLNTWTSRVIDDPHAKFKSDKLKAECLLNNGFKLLLVWSDEDKVVASNKIIEEITNAIDRTRTT